MGNDHRRASMSEDRLPGWDEPDRDELIRPLTLAEWDYLILCEQSVTAEPYEGRA